MVGRHAAGFFLRIAAGHSGIGHAAVHGCDVPQRVKADNVGTVQHFNASPTARVFAVRQAAGCAVAMAGQGFRCAAVPGHRADIGSFGHVEAVRNVQIYRRIVGAADGNGFNALNFHLVGNVTHPCIVAVYAAVAALVAHRNGAADNEARSLGSSQQHTLHAGFGGCNLILQAVAGAAFQNAAIFKVEMAQLPHIQHIQAVTVAPHRIVSSLLAGQGQTRDRAVEVRHGQARAACKCALCVQAAGKGSVPGHCAALAVGGHVLGVGREAVGQGAAPAFRQVAAVVDNAAQQGRGEGVDGCQRAGDVKFFFAFNGKNVHSAIGQAYGVGTNVPGHTVFRRPVFRVCAVGCQGCRALSCKIVRRGARRVGGHGRAGKFHGVGFVGLQHGKEAQQALVFAVVRCCGQRPPGGKNLRCVRVVQQGLEGRVGVFRASASRCDCLQQVGNAQLGFLGCNVPIFSKSHSSVLSVIPHRGKRLKYSFCCSR